MEETPSIQQSEFRASTPDERENALGGNMQQVPQSNEIEGPVEEQDKSHEFVSMDSMIASLNEMVKDMSEAELRTRLEMIVGKSVNIHNMDDLTDEDMKKIIANPMAGAYFRALVTKGWTHTDGDGSSFDQRAFNELTKFDQSIASQCRVGGKGRDLLAFSDNAAFVKMGMGDALKDDIKSYGNDETQGLLDLARRAVDTGMNLKHANLIWDEIVSKVDHGKPVSDFELVRFKMAGALRVTKEITPKEVDRLSSQGGLKYGRLIKASRIDLEKGQKSVFNIKTQLELERLRLEGDEKTGDVITHDELEAATEQKERNEVERKAAEEARKKRIAEIQNDKLKELMTRANATIEEAKTMLSEGEAISEGRKKDVLAKIDALETEIFEENSGKIQTAYDALIKSMKEAQELTPETVEIEES